MSGAFTRDTNYKTALLADDLHPTPAGYIRMADIWYAAIGKPRALILSGGERHSPVTAPCVSVPLAPSIRRTRQLHASEIPVTSPRISVLRAQSNPGMRWRSHVRSYHYVSVRIRSTCPIDSLRAAPACVPNPLSPAPPGWRWARGAREPDARLSSGATPHADGAPRGGLKSAGRRESAP